MIVINIIKKKDLYRKNFSMRKFDYYYIIVERRFYYILLFLSVEKYL